jgi:hypothetical protein
MNVNSPDFWSFENGWYQGAPISRISKLIAHWELYKEIVAIPGDIVELGVYKGSSLIRFATFRQLLENDFSRKIHGFDIFGSFPRNHLDLVSDINFVSEFEKQGGPGLDSQKLNSILTTKGFKNIFLHEGNILNSLETFLREEPQTRIALLHLDLDVFVPTEFALNLLYERVVPGGLILFDDFNFVEGATLAIENFCRLNDLKLIKTQYYASPSYIRKP